MEHSCVTQVLVVQQSGWGLQEEPRRAPTSWGWAVVVPALPSLGSWVLLGAAEGTFPPYQLWSACPHTFATHPALACGALEKLLVTARPGVLKTACTRRKAKVKNDKMAKPKIFHFSGRWFWC